ncbi:MAG: hypothetical protein R3264_08850 [Anaerolineae bacterium]|nr:hypothetical protein [Anaerolineae bacterium]
MTELASNSFTAVTYKITSARWVSFAFRLLALMMGGLHTWAAASSHSMNSDGVDYLDIGDAYMRGDWQMAINAVWSPLYSWILGPVLALFQPTMRWEFPLVHGVNFAIYVAALICFEFFWRQLWHYQQMKKAEASDQVTWPEWAWLALGYCLFIWSALTLIKIWAVTPDMLMAGLVYLAAGLMVRLRRGFTGWPTYALLGAVLGLGYLSKAIMFPLAFVFLGVTLISGPNIRRAFPRTLLAGVIFLLVSLPFIALISRAEGKFTFGEAGAITYVRYVNGVTYPHWQGHPPGNGTPEHPSRQIFDRPPIYEFGTPLGGTYPISLNPVYWYRGAIPHFDVAQQLRLLLASGLFYFDLFFRQQGGWLVGVAALYLLRQRWGFSLKDVGPGWGLVIPAVAAFGLYSIVLVEGRYIGAFVVLFWSDILANVRLPDSRDSRRLLAGVGTLMILFVLVNLVAFNLAGFRDLNRNAAQPPSASADPPRWPGEVAETLHRLGVQPGDEVAVIGYAFDSFWARLARVKIVAEMLDRDADPFWVGDSALQDEVIAAFAGTGAKAIVAEHVPAYASLPGWHQIGNTNHYIYLLR